MNLAFNPGHKFNKELRFTRGFHPFAARGPFLEAPGKNRARWAVLLFIKDESFKSFEDGAVKLSANETKWTSLEVIRHPTFLETLISKYDFGPGSFEKRAPGHILYNYCFGSIWCLYPLTSNKLQFPAPTPSSIPLLFIMYYYYFINLS